MSNLSLIKASTIPVTWLKPFQPIPHWVECRWSDSEQHILNIQKQLKSDFHLFSHIQESLEKLNLLKNYFVWIKTKENTLRLDLFSIYSDCLRLGKLSQENLKMDQEVHISFMSKRGPFIKKTLGECLNPQVYQEMAQNLVLNNLIPIRKFRLRMKVKLLAEFGQNYSDSTLIDLHQLSSEGMLLTTQKNIMTHDDPLRLLINPSALDLWLDDKNTESSFDQSLFTLKKDFFLKISTLDLIEQKPFYREESKRYYFLPLKCIPESNPYFFNFCQELLLLSRGKYQLTLS
jgi:hypothetical protein